MPSDYHIEDLVFQNGTHVVYRVRTPDGSPLALIRLRYDDQTPSLLQAGRFPNALKELQSLQHPNLRPVFAGGLDPVDSAPWLVTPWRDGQALSHRIAQGPVLTKNEIERIKTQGSALVEALGSFAGTVSFTPASVITSGASSANLTDSFSIDYHGWFSAFARDTHPSSLSASYQKLADLLSHLRPHREPAPASVFSNLGPSTLPQGSIAPAAPSSFPIKILILASILIIGIAGSFWYLNQKNDPSPEVASLPTKPETKTPTEHPPSKKADRSERPFDFRIPTIQADNPSKITTHLQQWVSLSGKVSGADSTNHLLIENSTVKAKLAEQLPPTGAKGLIDRPIVITGWLTNQNLLEVTDLSEVKVTYPKKDIFETFDELQLRGMHRETITLEAEVVRLSESKKGKTLYLDFHENQPSFRVQILRSKLNETFTHPFLESLVGQKARFTGKISVRKSKGVISSTSILISDQSQIEIVK